MSITVNNINELKDAHSTNSEKLNIESFTSAKLKAIQVLDFHQSKDILFDVISDHSQLKLWVPMIRHEVLIDHSGSLTKGKNDVGSIRICNFGGDILKEKIVSWTQDESYAYSILHDKKNPIVNHLGIFQILENDHGCKLIWKQYFDTKPWSLKSKMMPFVMKYVMRKALLNLKKLLDEKN